MIALDPESKDPVYKQIVDNVRTMVVMSKMHPHEQITSVRALARRLGVNPNTVQKAYRILKEEGIIYSLAGRGDFVADVATSIKKMKREQIEQTFRAATLEARDAGMWIEDIFTIVDDAYSGN